MKFLFTLLLVFFTFTASANRNVYVSGGQQGGTFNAIAKGIADYVSDKTGGDYEHFTSGGSIDNLQKVNNRMLILASPILVICILEEMVF